MITDLTSLLGRAVLLGFVPMVRRNDISKADSNLFREAVGEVRRISVAAPALQKPRPVPRANQLRADEARIREELLSHALDPMIEVGDELQHLKEGHAPRLLKRLRRGHFSVRAEIDLHQMSAAVARDAVRLFLDDCHRNGEYCVRIIHGKGLRSQRGPVLKRLVDGMLRLRADVIAFASAPPTDGGTGAVIVLLQRD